MTVVFGSRNVLVHIARGIAGFGALACALSTMNATLWPSVVLLPLSLYLLRGCPICWTIGLFETALMRVHRNAAETGAEGDAG